MNFTKQIMFGLFALAASIFTASAQGNFDYFAAPKTIVISPPQILTQSAATTLQTTNVANISRFLGVAVMDIYSISNSAGAAVLPTNTFTLYSSITGTNNWIQMTNVAFATSTTIITTNYVGTTNSAVIYTTNTFMVPGTISNAVVALNGFSGQWTQPAPFTSSATGNSGPTANWTIGFDSDNAGNYIQLVWSTSGSNAVYNTAAIMRGRTKQGLY